MSFTTQSVDQICPIYSGISLWSKNLNFIDWSDLEDVFKSHKDYVLINIAASRCAPCRNWAAYINNNLNLQSILWDNSNCGFVAVTWDDINRNTNLKTWKNAVWWFVAEHSNSVNNTSDLLNLWIDISSIPRYALMQRDGSYIDDNIDFDEVSQYCHSCVLETSSCGNSIVENTEECDDGNLNNNDGCDNTCKFEKKQTGTSCFLNEECESWYCYTSTTGKCVSGIYGEKISCAWLTSKEQCEQFKQDAWENWEWVSVCKWEEEITSVCKEQICGDSIVDPNEQCDGVGQAQCGKWATCTITGKVPCTCQYSEVIVPDKIPDDTGDTDENSDTIVDDVSQPEKEYKNWDTSLPIDSQPTLDPMLRWDDTPSQTKRSNPTDIQREEQAIQQNTQKTFDSTTTPTFEPKKTTDTTATQNVVVSSQRPIKNVDISPTKSVDTTETITKSKIQLTLRERIKQTLLRFLGQK